MNKINEIIPEFVSKVLNRVTRLETVNHTKCDSCFGSGVMHIEGQPGIFECPVCHGQGMSGRNVVFWDSNKQIVDIELQDDGHTLKIFISDREIKNGN